MSSVPSLSSLSPSDQPAFRYTAALANQIETSWQDRWAREGAFAQPNPGEPGFDASKPKKFILDMFPYPSGVGLHVGHPLGYIATDVYSRFLRMTGHNVAYSMGFDSFGLPAEQYAVQTNTHPRVTTERNIANMRRQLRRLGLSHDARRSVSTTDEAFYKWTQWIFLQIYNSWYDPAASGGKGAARPISELIAAFRKGAGPEKLDKPWDGLSEEFRHRVLSKYRLAFLAEVPVNWCPMLGTVLANEEVTADGKSERGNFPVYKRPLKQWMMRITSYADRLAADLDLVDWPEAIKIMQRNWIGRSEGAYVDFECSTRRIRVFTTRPDTLYGATYMVLSPEHAAVEHLVPEKYNAHTFTRAIFPGADELIARNASPKEMVEAYRAYAKSKTDDERTDGKEKTGCFTGAYALNPVNQKRVPVFIADYVLAGYGTGAIMAVPAHDERDWEFAKAFGLPIAVVVAKPSTGGTPVPPEADECLSEEGVVINSAMIDGLSTAEAKKKITAHLESIGFGKGAVQYKLRDWLFSRQRYWGEPFPIVFDEQGLAHDLPESMLPVTLPPMDNFQPESSEDPDAPPRPPLARATEWMTVDLDLGDGRGVRTFTRESNTMPNWAGSCWYYLRYLDPSNSSALIGKAVEQYWMAGADGKSKGVDLYVGGVEHAVLHLLYARFWHKVLMDLGHVSTPEPFGKLFSQGYIQAFAYKDERGVYVEAEEVTEGPEVQIPIRVLESSAGVREPVMQATTYYHHGKPVFREYGKMGKSLKNAVAPDQICEEYGCDTLRLYEMSMGPLEASKPWNTRDIAGAYRFLQRVWRNLVDEATGAVRVSDDAPSADLLRSLHKTIKGVRRDIETLGFNTAVSKLIELNNELTKAISDGRAMPRAIAEPLVLIIAPLAPHMAEELWSKLGHASSLTRAPFPVADEALAADNEVEIPVQVQGKVRGRIMVPAGLDVEGLTSAAKASEVVQALIGGKEVKKMIVVPGKMINLVLGG